MASPLEGYLSLFRDNLVKPTNWTSYHEKILYSALKVYEYRHSLPGFSEKEFYEWVDKNQFSTEEFTRLLINIQFSILLNFFIPPENSGNKSFTLKLTLMPVLQFRIFHMLPRYENWIRNMTYFRSGTPTIEFPGFSEKFPLVYDWGDDQLEEKFDPSDYDNKPSKLIVRLVGIDKTEKGKVTREIVEEALLAGYRIYEYDEENELRYWIQKNLPHLSETITKFRISVSEFTLITDTFMYSLPNTQELNFLDALGDHLGQPVYDRIYFKIDGSYQIMEKSTM